MKQQALQKSLRFYASRLHELQGQMQSAVIRGLTGELDEATSLSLLQEIENEVDGIQECIHLLEFLRHQR